MAGQGHDIDCTIGGAMSRRMGCHNSRMVLARKSPESQIAASNASLLLQDQLCFALYAATNVITRAYREPLASLGLTYPQYIAMLVLWEQGRQTVKSLAERLDLDSSTVTPLVQRLAGAGLVHTSRDESDRRNLSIELTTQGRALRKQAALVQKQVACKTQLQPDNFIALRAQLHRLAIVMSQPSE